MNKSQNQNVLWAFSQPILTLLGFLQTDGQISLHFQRHQLVKSLPFNLPEACKRYPFRAEPPRIGHYRDYPGGGGGGTAPRQGDVSQQQPLLWTNRWSLSKPVGNDTFQFTICTRNIFGFIGEAIFYVHKPDVLSSGISLSVEIFCCKFVYAPCSFR